MQTFCDTGRRVDQATAEVIFRINSNAKTLKFHMMVETLNGR